MSYAIEEINRWPAMNRQISGSQLRLPLMLNWKIFSAAGVFMKSVSIPMKTATATRRCWYTLTTKSPRLEACTPANGRRSSLETANSDRTESAGRGSNYAFSKQSGLLFGGDTNLVQDLVDVFVEQGS